jgi:putative ABC transport system permease protein
MSALNRKLFRDTLHTAAQAVAISLVLACGVATFVMSLCTYASMLQTREHYYDRYSFASVFTHLKRAPNSLGARIAEIPGVAAAQTRVVVDVTLDLPDIAEPATGRLISIPEYQSQQLNQLHIRSGRYIAPRSEGEVIVDEAFAEAHHFGPGTRVKAIINGKLDELTIVGIALSPEYVYTIQPGQIFPDNKRFGVFWMAYPELSAAFGLMDSFNDVALTLTYGASEPEVLKRLDDLTASYGGTGAYARADQLSHRFVSDELIQLRAMATIVPITFFAVAAFLLNVVLNRLISTQREQIAALKAFGYTRREVGWHFLKFALLIVLLGTFVGIGFGAWLGRGVTRMYTQFFRFPTFEFYLDPRVVVFAIVISVTAGGLAVAGAVRRAMRLPPAEAMRPEAPAIYRPTVVERLGLQRFFSQPTRMVLRQIERRPFRAALSILGVALSIAVMILGSFSKDIIDHIADVQFERSQRYNFHLSFVEPASARALQEIKSLPGVLRAEPFRSIPVRLHAGPRSRLTGLIGLPQHRQLLQLIDLRLHVATLPEEGLVISKTLAESLDLKVGDLLTVETMEGERRTIDVHVADLLDDFGGTSAYMDLAALNRLLHEGDTVSGAFIATDPAHASELYAALKNTPRIAGVTSKQAALASFRKTIAENFLRMRLFNVLFGCTIAIGVVYNSARIALSERSRELATLRVIGFTRREVSSILLGEVGLLIIAAIPLGLLIGYWFAVFATAAMQTETQRFPAIVQTSTFAFAVAVVLIAAIASSVLVRRRLDQLDLVGVLKSRD